MFKKYIGKYQIFFTQQKNISTKREFSFLKSLFGFIGLLTDLEEFAKFQILVFSLSLEF